jgi:hypothetical protein
LHKFLNFALQNISAIEIGVEAIAGGASFSGPRAGAQSRIKLCGSEVLLFSKTLISTANSLKAVNIDKRNNLDSYQSCYASTIFH